MPLYAYRCDDCKEQFSVFLSYADYGKKTVNCVYCGSARIHRKIDRIRIAKPGRKDFSSGPLPSGPEDTEDPRMLGRMPSSNPANRCRLILMKLSDGLKMGILLRQLIRSMMIQMAAPKRSDSWKNAPVLCNKLL